MSDNVTVDGREYISSKRASELSGYAQDYIGQLARGGHIDAQRIGGLWFVFLQSLEAYKVKAEEYKPVPPKYQREDDPEALITFDGKDYVSAARGAKLTGYHQDYVGQLAREGTILSRQVANRWYVERDGLLSHKKEKDALLAAVQAQSVGMPERSAEETEVTEEAFEGPSFTYRQEKDDLVPVFQEGRALRVAEEVPEPVMRPAFRRRTPVPEYTVPSRELSLEIPQKGKSYALIGSALVLFAIVGGVGYLTLMRGNQQTATAGNASTSTTTSFLERVGAFAEGYLIPEMVYRRP